MDCEGCRARDSEISFLREMVTRLTTEKEVGYKTTPKAYIGHSDGSIEYLDSSEEEDSKNEIGL